MIRLHAAECDNKFPDFDQKYVNFDRRHSRMSGGHFGIDLRRNKNSIPEIRPIGPARFPQRTGFIPPGSPFRPNAQPARPATTLASYSRKYGSQYASQVAFNISSGHHLPDININPPDLSKSFDEMMRNTRTKSLHSAIEEAVQSLFNAESVTLWIHDAKASRLIAPGKGTSTSFDKSLVGFTFSTKEIQNIEIPEEHPSYDKQVDSEKPSLCFPLYDADGEICSVLQITRVRKWDLREIQLAESLTKKFENYAHFLFGALDLEALRKATEVKSENPISEVLEKIRAHFSSRSCELWNKDTLTGAYALFTDCLFTAVGSDPGAVETVFANDGILNMNDVTKSPLYSSDMDGDDPESVLAIPFRDRDQSFALVLRGKENNGQFTYTDETAVRTLVPLISKCLQVEDAAEETYDSSFALRLQALLEVAEILSGVLDIDNLVPTIMERACSLLHTERCSLFLVSNDRKELITRFHGGLDQAIRMPINCGIVGHTATTGEIMNITDAYNDPRFDNRVDKETGFKTKTILTVPIFNNRGEIAGVTEMINREDGEGFDDADIKMLVAFNVFCGISLDNAKLYQVSLDLTRQLRGFVEMSNALNNTKTISDIMTEIAEKAKNVISAVRCTVFLANVDNSNLNMLVSLGEPLVHGTLFADIAAKERQSKLFSYCDVLRLTGAAASGNKLSKDRKSGSMSSTSSIGTRVSSLFVKEGTINSGRADDGVTICCFPLLTSDARVLGVMELCARLKIMPEDMKLLDCFAVFATFSLEKVELKQIADFGRIEVRLKQSVAEDERQSCSVIPVGLQIPQEQQETIFKINFDAPAWDGIGHFKVVWTIFASFGLLEHFKITNEKFFRFLSEISDTYNKVPYHNWRHAVDVTQFVTYQIKESGLEKVLTKFELFALTVAAICHDANHDGFTNVFNVKAETPLGILFKNQSVMETHHCSVAIGIISKEECNLFEHLSAVEIKDMWNLVIKLILTTDMAKHHDFLKSVNDRLDKDHLYNNNPADRFMMMQLVLKCADISNVSRPFELADKWCDVLCEEFFRQGDLEKTSGMEYTSPLNDRAHLDKPKSQIGFYTFVCLPLYQTTARAIPQLQVNVDQVMSNLAIWKAATEAPKN